MRLSTALAVAAAGFVTGLAAPEAVAQARADGNYPTILSCEAASGVPASRDTFTLTVAAGRASYSIAGRETGDGAVSAGRLTLTGRGGGSRPYEARYSGAIGGRGGLLVGVQTRGSARRACQMTIGDGRG